MLYSTGYFDSTLMERPGYERADTALEKKAEVRYFRGSKVCQLALNTKLTGRRQPKSGIFWLP